MKLIHCTYDQHATAILAILNEAIVNSTALYDYKPRPPESMLAWFQSKESGRFPVVGAVSDAGGLLGFATYGVFRAWPGLLTGTAALRATDQDAIRIDVRRVPSWSTHRRRGQKQHDNPGSL